MTRCASKMVSQRLNTTLWWFHASQVCSRTASVLHCLCNLLNTFGFLPADVLIRSVIAMENFFFPYILCLVIAGRVSFLCSPRQAELHFQVVHLECGNICPVHGARVASSIQDIPRWVSTWLMYFSFLLEGLEGPDSLRKKHIPHLQHMQVLIHTPHCP